MTVKRVLPGQAGNLFSSSPFEHPHYHPPCGTRTMDVKSRDVK